MFSMIEPFCFYLPGGIGRYYEVHKNIQTKFADIIGSETIKKELSAHIVSRSKWNGENDDGKSSCRRE